MKMPSKPSKTSMRMQGIRRGGSRRVVDAVGVLVVLRARRAVAAVLKGLDNPFFQTMQSGVQDAATTNDVKVEVQAADVDQRHHRPGRQARRAGQPGLLLLHRQPDQRHQPDPGHRPAGGCQEDHRQHRHPRSTPTPPSGQRHDRRRYIGTDNVAAGKMAGDEMAELLPAGGEVVAIGGISGDVTSAARIDRLHQGPSPRPSRRSRCCPTVAANWDRQEALTQASTLLRANPDLAGFFVANDDMALGVARAVADRPTRPAT